MAAPMESSDVSSSSEEEEDSANLKEAVYEIVVKPKDESSTDLTGKNGKETKPSRRPDKERSDTDKFDNLYNTTPGFRRHVSRKLSEALDSDIDYIGQHSCDSFDNAEQNLGVKLFSSSKEFLQDKSSKEESIKPVRKRQLPSSDSSSEDERLAEASVSHDFVVKQSSLPYLTNQKPADIVITQTDQDMSATIVKDSDCKQSDSSRSKCEIKINVKTKERTNMDQLNKMEDKSDEVIKKHKKKKKKKHKKEEVN